MEAEYQAGESDPMKTDLEEEAEERVEQGEQIEDDEEEQEAGEDFEDIDKPHGTALLGLTPVDKVPITGCHNGTSCPQGESCIVSYNGTWSQCFSCSKATFGQECQKLDDVLRYAAVRTCKQTCLDTGGRTAGCFNKNWCFKPYRCIVDREAHWGQCISCHSKKFWENYCYKAPEGLRKIASRTCHRRCR